MEVLVMGESGVDAGLGSDCTPSLAERRLLTSTDPEPDLGTVVVDDDGIAWERTPNYGTRYGWSTVVIDTSQDPRSWVRLAGNHGPVVVVSDAAVAVRERDALRDAAKNLLDLFRGEPESPCRRHTRAEYDLDRNHRLVWLPAVEFAEVRMDDLRSVLEPLAAALEAVPVPERPEHVTYVVPQPDGGTTRYEVRKAERPERCPDEGTDWVAFAQQWVAADAGDPEAIAAQRKAVAEIHTPLSTPEEPT